MPAKRELVYQSRRLPMTSKGFPPGLLGMKKKNHMSVELDNHLLDEGAIVDYRSGGISNWSTNAGDCSRRPLHRAVTIEYLRTAHLAPTERARANALAKAHIIPSAYVVLEPTKCSPLLCIWCNQNTLQRITRHTRTLNVHTGPMK